MKVTDYHRSVQEQKQGTWTNEDEERYTTASRPMKGKKDNENLCRE